jgi:transcriptional regulator of acetoin/glycerol metabolism
MNALQFASVRCDAETVGAEHLPPEVRRGAAAGEIAAGLPAGAAAAAPGEAGAEAGPRRKKLTREAVERALAETGGNKASAAKLLGVGRATLYRFLGSPGPEKR